MLAEALWQWVQGAPHLVLFPLVLVEGPLATVLAGSLVAAGSIALPSAALIALVADLTADTGFFLLGRLGRAGRGRRFLERLGLTDARAAHLEARLTGNLPGVLAAAKVVDIAAVPALLAAGMSGIRYSRFIAWNALLTAPKVAVLLTLGAVFGSQAARHLDAGTVLALAAAGAATYLVVKNLLGRRAPAAAGGNHPCAS
ncbi:hypothetical protein NUM3379_33630 [Kineococcus sp. NUM-3379]